MARFSDLLDKKIDNFERPPALPVGHYTWQVSKHPDISDFTARSGVAYDRVTFNCTAIEPADDVDEDDLAAYGPINSTSVRKVFLIADGDAEPTQHARGMYDIRAFLEQLGIAEGTPLGEGLAESVNAQFMGELTHRADEQNPDIIYQEIGRTAPVE